MTVSQNTKLAAMFVVVGALAAIGTTTTTAFAQDTPPGIAEHADENVHENTGPVSEQDVVFHTGLCQAGITTEALEELGGCDILGSPGQSDEVRQD
jgi:hypothetical protein